MLSAQQPQHLAADREQQHRRDIAGPVEIFAQRGRPGQTVAAQRDEGGGEEAARARAEEAVVESDRAAHRRVARRADPLVRILVAHPRADQDVERVGEQQQRDHQRQRLGLDHLHQHRPADRSGEDDQRGRQVGAPVDQPLGAIVAHRDEGAEHRLQLVRAKREERRHPAHQQSRHHDQPAAAGDRVDEAGDKGDAGEDGVEPGFDHEAATSRSVPSEVEDRPSTSLGPSG